MKKFILIITILFFNLTFGQDKNDPTESIITEFKSKMKENNVTDFFMVKHVTYGTARVIDLKDPDSCIGNGNYFWMYGFWKNGNETWVKKYDNCGGFNAVKLTNSKPIKFFKKNIETLKKDKVEIYKVKPDRIVNGRKLSYFSGQSHTPQRYFWFFQNYTLFENYFDKYNLETEEDNKNLNYTSNNNLSIVKLNSLCEEIIYELEEKKSFNRLK
ncbi:hypothetical protein [Seonamhaeicola sp. ML3]|uniref:hypothetical protein n=1 Tax=Seonamhaeicola sp. ML3 TaxID=2937786 RepID=UPI00200F2359|nr:hypothetical protein [Seonamhaeicola sp. ML3]